MHGPINLKNLSLSYCFVSKANVHSFMLVDFIKSCSETQHYACTQSWKLILFFYLTWYMNSSSCVKNATDWSETFYLRHSIQWIFGKKINSHIRIMLISLISQDLLTQHVLSHCLLILCSPMSGTWKWLCIVFFTNVSCLIVSVCIVKAPTSCGGTSHTSDD